MKERKNIATEDEKSFQKKKPKDLLILDSEAGNYMCHKRLQLVR